MGGGVPVGGWVEKPGVPRRLGATALLYFMDSKMPLVGRSALSYDH